MATVVCRLPHGLIIELQPAVAELKGDRPPFNAEAERPPRTLVLKHGANEGVDREEIEAWLHANARLPVVRRRDVYVVPIEVSDRLARDSEVRA